MDERDQWMAAVRARLKRVTGTRDLGPVQEEAALTEACGLMRTLTGGSGDLPAQFLLGWLYWYRHQAPPHNEQDAQMVITMLPPCFISGMQGLPEPLLPILAELAIPAATSLLEQTLPSADPALLARTTDLWQRILAATSAGHPSRPVILNNLGIALKERFEHTGATADLDAAIEASQQAVQATPPGDPSRAGRLSNLGIALRERFERTGAMADLGAAITAFGEARQDTPANHPNYATILSKPSQVPPGGAT